MLDYISMKAPLDRAQTAAPRSAQQHGARGRALGVLAVAALLGCGGASGAASVDGATVAAADSGGADSVGALPPTAAGTGATPAGTSAAPAATETATPESATSTTAPSATDGSAPGATAPGATAPTATTPVTSAPGLAAPQPGLYAGTYHVPVTPDLEAYAHFDIESVRLDVRDGELVLEYDLPALLLGKPHGLSFRGTATADGSYVLEGADGTATCRAGDAGLTCDEVLQGIELDASKMDRVLASMPDAEALGRRSVAQQFSIDPIGVLQIPSLP